MIHYDAVLFDLDGTLLDTLGDLTAAVNHAMREGGYPEHTTDEVRGFIGEGVGTLMRRALPRSAEGDEAAFFQALQTFKLYYAEHNCDMTVPYPGVMEAVSALAEMGVKLAIISNKNQPNVTALANKYFGGLVSLAVGERGDERRKPAPDMLLRAMDAFGAPRERTLYVGDSDVDLLAASNARVDCATVLWGFQSEAELLAAGARTLIRDPRELVALVRSGGAGHP